MPAIRMMNTIHTWNKLDVRNDYENTYDIYEIRYLWKLSTDLWYKLKLTILQIQFKIHLNYKTYELLTKYYFYLFNKHLKQTYL